MGGSEPRLAIVVALPQESRAVARALRSLVRTREPFVRCGRLGDASVLLVEAGLGNTSARERVARTLRRFPEIRRLLAVGFGGGLTPRLATGDVVLAESIHVPGPPLGGGVERFLPDLLALERLAREGQPAGFHVGALLSVDRIVSSAAEKRQLAEETGALAAEMEFAGVARAATAAPVPVTYLRVVLDTAEDELPPDLVDLLDARGRPRLVRIARSILRRPGRVKTLLGLGSRLRVASESLARVVALWGPILLARSEELPEGIEGEELPEGIEGEELPEGIEGEELPKGIEGEELPKGIEGEELPDGIEGEELPERLEGPDPDAIA